MALVHCKPWPGTQYPVAPFWGINGHLGWNNTNYATSNAAQQAANIRALGMKTYRNGYGANYDTSGNVTSSAGAGAVAFINAYPDIIYCPVLLPQYVSSYTSSSTPGTEATAYTMGYNLGRDCALNLMGKVPWYEVGNEFDGSYWGTANGWDNAYMVSGSGYSATSYNNAKYLVCRGSVLGMWDGIRSVDSTTPIAWPGGTWVHLGFHQNLVNGTTPAATGTVDPTKIRKFDIMAWHMYTNNATTTDDYENIPSQGLAHSGNFFLCLQDVGGSSTPLIISEYGCNTVNTSTGAAVYPGGETDIVAALTTSGYLMDKFYAKRSTYNIISTQLYQLIDAYNNTTYPVDPNTYSVPTRYGVQNELGFGEYNQDGTTAKTRAASVTSFVLAHPV